MDLGKDLNDIKLTELSNKYCKKYIIKDGENINVRYKN